MVTFQQLYEKLVKASVENRMDGELASLNTGEFDPHHLDCLLNPKKHPLVLRTEECLCGKEGNPPCAVRCMFDAIFRDENGTLHIDPARCVGCNDCIDACACKKLTASKDVLPALDALRSARAPVYAMIAPAYVNQFSADITPGKLRAAFKRLGFTGMVEVALFADILTLKEALEFDRNIVTEKDYQLTSCCCPMWIAMIRKVYNELMPYVPAAVSPMVACGRAIKQMYPDALTVFIGPCLAKKAEAREKDIADAVDFVLTFHEIRDVFDAARIDPAKMKEDERDHSSRAGRIYATTGGVSEAVQKTVQRLNPNRPISVRAMQADGVAACKAMLNDLREGKVTANFLEGMGCVGGCVGGPKALIPKEEGRKNVYEYGDGATYQTPAENPYVVELLRRLGFETIESLVEHSDMFTRDFGV